MSRSPLRVLITGATGCAGTHLSKLAIAHGAQVFGIALSGSFVAGVSGQLGDMTERSVIEQVVGETRPDWIFHLAALIPGVAGNPLPARYIDVNITGTYYLLDAARRLAPEARALIASSSAVYGQPAHPEQAIAEDSPLQPHSLYGTTKVAQEMLALQFFIEHGLHTIRTRTFNQTGPREPANLVCATLARQIALIEAGQQEPILRAVTLVPRRDFSDVRDIVACYWAALEHGTAGLAYNICSGRSASIRRVAEILIRLSRVRGIPVIETGPAPGPHSILNQIGDGSRLRGCAGARPRIPLEQSLRDLLDEWRSRVE